MTPQTLYDALALPASTHLGKRVFKKLFLDRPELTAADRRALTDDVELVTWQHTLKPSTVPIAAYVDDEREYLEIALLEVTLRRRKTAARLAEVMHRTIPYPLVLVLADAEAVALSLAPKRMSRAERDKVVAEDLVLTPWLDASALTEPERAFLASLAVNALPQTHFLALYDALVERALALRCAAHSGRFHLAPERTPATLREALTRCEAFARELAEVRAAYRREPDFARQLTLHTRLKRLERLHHEAVAQL